MGQNLKAYVEERSHMSAQEVLENLADQAPGRGIGEFFVTESTINGTGELVIELDDGCKFAFTCRKLN
jgi:hypothetical protein